MDLHLGGKVAVVTGGGSGIGKAAALEFAREGCKVAICGRTIEKLQAAKKEFEDQGFGLYIEAVDVTDIPAMRRFAENVEREYGRIDIWVNNAGVNIQKKMMEYTEEDWDYIYNINLKSVFFNTKIAVGHMEKHGDGGVIINASSYAALMPHVDRAIYAGAKSGVLSLTKAFAAALAPQNIRVVAYIPGLILTDINRKMLSDPERYQKSVRDIAMNRLGEPEDLAKTLVFLASDAAGYITGNHIEISGGKFCVQDPTIAWKW